MFPHFVGSPPAMWQAGDIINRLRELWVSPAISSGPASCDWELAYLVSILARTVFPIDPYVAGDLALRRGGEHAHLHKLLGSIFV